MPRLRRREGLDQRASAAKGLEPKSSLVIWPGEIQGRCGGDIGEIWGELVGDLARVRARAGDKAGLRVGVGLRVRIWG